jgi:hypothetical protein
MLPRSDQDNPWFNLVRKYMEDDYEGSLTRTVGKDRERLIIEKKVVERRHHISGDDDEEGEKEKPQPFWRGKNA